MTILITLLALFIEVIVGYPDWLVRAIGHPVTWIGRLIAWLDGSFNRDNTRQSIRKAAGLFSIGFIVIVAAASGFVSQAMLLNLPLGFVLVSFLGSALLAQRSLYSHVERVASALGKEGIEAARREVSHIVGRDPQSLDRAGVARAAIESLAENFADGVVAPAFWMAVAGLPGALVYKAVNTADSMIGHRTPRHEAFGYGAAKLDDLMNLPASRLTAILLITAAAVTSRDSARAAWKAVRRDARLHRSPNAGYPEAAIAGALALSLAGPRVYAGVTVDDALMGDGTRDAHVKDIRAALVLYRRADLIFVILMAVLAAAWFIVQ